MQMVVFLFLFASFFTIFTGFLLFEIERVQNVAKKVGKFEEAEYLKRLEKHMKTETKKETQGQSSRLIQGSNISHKNEIYKFLLAGATQDEDLVQSSLLLQDIIILHNELLW